METITLCFSPWHEIAILLYTRDRGILKQFRKMDEMHNNYTKQEPDFLHSNAGALTLKAIASL